MQARGAGHARRPGSGERLLPPAPGNEQTKLSFNGMCVNHWKSTASPPLHSRRRRRSRAAVRRCWAAAAPAPPPKGGLPLPSELRATDLDREMVLAFTDIYGAGEEEMDWLHAKVLDVRGGGLACHTGWTCCCYNLLAQWRVFTH